MLHIPINELNFSIVNIWSSILKVGGKKRGSHTQVMLLTASLKLVVHNRENESVLYEYLCHLVTYCYTVLVQLNISHWSLTVFNTHDTEMLNNSEAIGII